MGEILFSFSNFYLKYTSDGIYIIKNTCNLKIYLMNISEYLSWLIYHETLTFGLHCLVREKKIKNKYVFSQRIKYYNSTIVDQYFLAKFIWSIS